MKLEDYPGYMQPEELGQYYYIEYSGPTEFSEVYPTIVDSCDELQDGGSFNEEAVLTTPVGTNYHAISCRGDTVAWEKGIRDWCVQRNLRYGTIVEGDFVISDGTSFHLSECSLKSDW
ncbi:MAG: hypothetical protein ACE37H_17130 [Phycisphaeraceae bacterium]